MLSKSILPASNILNNQQEGKSQAEVVKDRTSLSINYDKSKMSNPTVRAGALAWAFANNLTLINKEMDKNRENLTVERREETKKRKGRKGKGQQQNETIQSGFMDPSSCQSKLVILK